MRNRKYTGMLKGKPCKTMYNEVLEIPQTRKTTTPIYNILGKEYMICADYFTVKFDNSDHFEFWCGNCNTKADILTVEYKLNYGGYGDKQYHPIFFILGCNLCGNTGQRKVYCKLDDEIVKESYCK